MSRFIQVDMRRVLNKVDMNVYSANIARPLLLLLLQLLLLGRAFIFGNEEVPRQQHAVLQLGVKAAYGPRQQAEALSDLLHPIGVALRGALDLSNAHQCFTAVQLRTQLNDHCTNT